MSIEVKGLTFTFEEPVAQRVVEEFLVRDLRVLQEIAAKYEAKTVRTGVEQTDYIEILRTKNAVTEVLRWILTDDEFAALMAA